MNHFENGDSLDLISGAAALLDAVVSFTDIVVATLVPTPDKQDTAISTAATTPIMNTPAAGSVRAIRTMTIRNKHATLSCPVTLVFNTAVDKEIYSTTLLPGETLEWAEQLGFYTLKQAAGIASIFNTGIVDQGPGFATDTYITGSNLLIGGRIKVGTILRWTIHATKTAAGLATPIFIVRFGTAGAIGDTARCTLTGPAQTAALDTGTFVVVGIVRAHSATGVVKASVDLDHSAASAAGFGNCDAQVTSGAFDTTVAGLQAGISVNGGASAAWTVQGVTAEATNLA